MKFKNIKIVNKIFFVFLALLFLSFLALPYLKNQQNVWPDFLKYNFPGEDLAEGSLIRNIYPVEIKNTKLEPEEIYIQKNDVIKFINSTDNIARIRNLNSSFAALNSHDDFFKKFDEPGEYTYEIVLKENDTKLYGKIFVK